MLSNEYITMKIVEDHRKDLERVKNNGNRPHFTITSPINNRWTRAKNR